MISPAKFAPIASSLLGQSNQFFFVVAQFAQTVDSLDTLNTQGDLGGEEVNALVLEQWRVDERWLDNVDLTGQTVQNGASESSTGSGHRQGGGTSTVLGSDNLVTTESDSVDQGVSLVSVQVLVVGSREQWNNGDTRVSTDNSDLLVGWVGAHDFGDESGGSNDVQGGDTEQLLGVVDALGSEDLGDNWHGGVDRVGDHTHSGVGGVVGNGLGQVSDNGGVGVEQVVSGHTRLSWDTSWDDNDVRAGQGSVQALWFVTLDGRVGGDVRHIGGDTWSTLQVIQGQVGDLWVQFQQQRERLSDTSTGTQDGDLVGVGGGGGERSSSDFKHHSEKNRELKKVRASNEIGCRTHRSGVTCDVDTRPAGPLLERKVGSYGGVPASSAPCSN